MGIMRAFRRLFGRKKKFRSRDDERLERCLRLATVQRLLAKKEARLEKQLEKLRQAEAKCYKHLDRLEKKLSHGRG